MGTVKRKWTESMCLTAEEEERMPMAQRTWEDADRETRQREERMPMSRIIETRVTRSPSQAAAVQAAAMCPECDLHPLHVSQSLRRETVPGKAQQTEYFAVCSCGCEFTITWEDANGP